MMPLYCGMGSHPYLSSFLLVLNAVAHFYLDVLPAGCLSSLLCPNFFLDLWWARLRLFRGNTAYKLAKCSDSGKASASMNTVSRGGWWLSAPASTPFPHLPAF